MKIYVGNLDYRVNDEELKNLFAEYGEVVSAKIILDRETGRSKGFGFVEMSNDNEAKTAIEELHNGEWGSKKIIVNEARPQVNKPDRNKRRPYFN
jgi:RNA recognition motif-containing protein